MADSRFNIRITASDETAKARKQAEEGFNRLSRPVTRVAEAAKGFTGDSGVGALIEKYLGVSKAVRNVVGAWAESAGAGKTRVAGLSKNVAGLANAGRTAGAAMGEAGAAAEGASGAMGEAGFAVAGAGAAAGAATLGIGLIVAAYGAATAAALKFAGAASESGAAVGRTAQTIGVSSRDLQLFRAASAYAGVSADAMTESLHGLGVTLNNAQWGRDPQAMMAMNKLGLRMKYTKDGLVDTKAEMLDLADAISKIKSPQGQEKAAALFGVTGALPWLRQGRAGMAKDLDQAMRAAGVATDEQIKKDMAYQRQAAVLHQQWGRVKRQIGEAVMPFASWNLGVASGALDFLLNAPERISTAWRGVSDFFARLWPQVASGFRSATSWIQDQIGKLQKFVQDLLDKLPKPVKQAAAQVAQATAVAAGRAGRVAAGAAAQTARVGATAAREVAAVVPDAKAVTAPVARACDAFAAAIERQESRGHQFRRPGVPLESGRGAVGVMQLLPETAKAAAGRAGVAWDPGRFRTDAAYNRMLGRAELERLLKKFDGDMTLAAAAYNAGEGRLTGWRDSHNRHHAGWLEQFGDPRKGQISDADFAKLIPFRETRDYVAKTAGQVAPQPGPPAAVRIDINHNNAPAGVRTTVQASGNVDVNVGHSALAQGAAV